MKRKAWTPHLIGAAFAFALSVSAVGNLATGFDLKINAMPVLFLWCAWFAFISALLFRFKYGGAVLLGLSVLIAPLFWKDGLLWDQLLSLIYTISSHFHIVYSWPILGEPVTDEVSRPLIVLSAWASFSVSWVFCRRKHIIAVVPPVIAPLVFCLFTTDTVPDVIYLYLVILGIGLLLVTDWTRRNYPAQGIRLTLRLAVPLAAALALLFIANPREEYVNKAESFQKEVVSWFQRLQDGPESLGGGVSFNSPTTQKLNLKNVGPKGRNSRSVMGVNSPVDGTVYLRGRDYDVYTGTGWESSLDRHEAFTYGARYAGKLSIVTYGVRDVLYVPYYSVQEIMLNDGVLDNDENLREYSYNLSLSASGAADVPDSGYTALPEDTLRWASGLDVILDAASLPQSEIVHRIGSYVKNSATYDLSTSRMSSAYHDFAQWFLEESDTGYCVHFATAATVLLRAAGIPARYVEGYMVSADAGVDVIVTNQDAHAWVEYFDSGSGVWRVLEATPADQREEDNTTMNTTAGETEPNLSETEGSPLEGTTADDEQTQPFTPDDVPGNLPGPTVKKPFKLPEWTKTVFRALLAAAVIPVQSKIRIAWKRKRWNQGKPNVKTVARWRQTKGLARLVKEQYPEELENLAQKAFFSQHRIRDDELRLFEEYRESLLASVRGMAWYKRVLLRWVFAIDR